MSRYFCTPAQMRELENRACETGVTLYELMEKAGAAAAAFTLKLMNKKNIRGRAAVLCGKGNNGGDGFVTAKNLSEAGIPVTCILTSESSGTDLAARELGSLYNHGKVNVLMPADGIEAACDALYYSSVIIDAVFGTGFHGELPPEASALLRYADGCKGFKIALDIPSGGSGLTGAAAEGTLKCDATAAFGLEKIGTALFPLSEYCGELEVFDIGIPNSCVKSMDGLIREVDGDTVKSFIPVRPKTSHKGNFGKVLNIAGSKNMTGAAALSTKAALRSGAGLVKTASVRSVVKALSSSIYESTYMTLKKGENGEISAENAEALIAEMNRSTVCSLGCGLSVTENTKKLVKELINNAEAPLIIDADGINCLADCIDIIRNAKGGAAVTPHPAELSRLLGVPTEQVLSDRYTAAASFCSHYETAILAKGSPTFIFGGSSAYVSFTGNPGLSRGGSGDVLTGIAAGLAAMGLPLTEALACAAYIHGRAADIAAEELSETGMLPCDVIGRLPFVFKELDR